MTKRRSGSKGDSHPGSLVYESGILPLSCCTEISVDCSAHTDSVVKTNDKFGEMFVNPITNNHY